MQRVSYQIKWGELAALTLLVARLDRLGILRVLLLLARSFGYIDFLHLFAQVLCFLVSEQYPEIVIIASLILLGECELFSITRCIVEAEVLGDSALAGT